MLLTYIHGVDDLHNICTVHTPYIAIYVENFYFNLIYFTVKLTVRTPISIYVSCIRCILLYNHTCIRPFRWNDTIKVYIQQKTRQSVCTRKSIKIPRYVHTEIFTKNVTGVVTVFYGIAVFIVLNTIQVNLVLT